MRTAVSSNVRLDPLPVLPKSLHDALNGQTASSIRVLSRISPLNACQAAPYEYKHACAMLIDGLGLVAWSATWSVSFHSNTCNIKVVNVTHNPCRSVYQKNSSRHTHTSNPVTLAVRAHQGLIMHRNADHIIKPGCVCNITETPTILQKHEGEST